VSTNFFTPHYKNLEMHNFIDKYIDIFMKKGLTEHKIEQLIKFKKKKKSNNFIAKELKVTKRRVLQIWSEYKRTGKTPVLLKRGKKPDKSEKYKEVVKKLFHQLLISPRILKKELDKLKINISHMTIYKILKKERYINMQKNKQRQRVYVKYERQYSDELWHMDWAEFDGLKVLAIIDDASRFIVGYGIFNEATVENTIEVTKKAIEKYGKPDAILTDRGSQFYYNKKDGDFKTAFQVFLEMQNIKHIVGRVNHPQTNGKVERLFGVIKYRWKYLLDFNKAVNWHNNIKPHMCLNYDRPYQAYHYKQRPEKLVGWFMEMIG
jgi:putative transposase